MRMQNHQYSMREQELSSMGRSSRNKPGTMKECTSGTALVVLNVDVLKERDNRCQRSFSSLAKSCKNTQEPSAHEKNR